MSGDSLKIAACCVLLVTAINALLPVSAGAEFVCRADVSYSWKKEPEKAEKGEQEANTEAKVDWSTAEGIGADEAAAKAKLAESSKRELRRAMAACEERHNNLSRCIANKFASVSSLFSSISFTARRNLEPAIENVIIVEPMVYDGWIGLQPLSTLLAAIQPKEEFEAEMTLLFNAALVHWRVDFDRLDAVRLLLQKVRGAMNIGLEAARSASPRPIEEIHEALGLQRIYRAGLTKIFTLRSLARRRSHELEDRAPLDGPSLAILEAATLPFPEMPAFFAPDGSFKSEDDRLISGTKAIETSEEVNSLMRALKSIGN